MSLKLLPAALLLFVVIAAGLGQAFQTTDAAVTGDLVPSNGSMISGATPITITVPVGAPNPNEDVTITVDSADGDVSGTLVVIACTPNCPTDLGDATDVDDGAGLIVETDGLSQIVVALALTCSEESTVDVTADTATDEAASTAIACAPDGDGGDGGGGIVAGGQVAATASPNLLPCEGGTSVITAEVVGTLGEVLEDATFRFETSAGELVQTSDNTAELTLGPNQVFAVVRAKIFDPSEADAPETAQVAVSLACNNTGGQTLVVTASPNVVDCTGTSVITASVRDANGHVVPGKGFHFVTSAGLLAVDPNNANTEEGRATLTLRAGDGNATVVVTSGALFGTYQETEGVTTETVDGEATTTIPGVEEHFVDGENPGEGLTALVTVQQDCLGNTTGQIRVNASAKNLTCGENVFIGLSVIDEDIQTVLNGTPMTLIATAGGFYGGEGTLLSAAQVPTTNGEANTIYTAPANFNGEVKITAASGDAYGYETLNVTCVIAPNTGVGTGAAPSAGPATGGGTSNASAPTCTPIGDGVCIPNAITPPNTGSGGMK